MYKKKILKKFLHSKFHFSPAAAEKIRVKKHEFKEIGEKIDNSSLTLHKITLIK